VSTSEFVYKISATEQSLHPELTQRSEHSKSGLRIVRIVNIDEPPIQKLTHQVCTQHSLGQRADDACRRG